MSSKVILRVPEDRNEIISKLLPKIRNLNSGTTCLNDAWTIDNSGTCVPKHENFNLHCRSNGIEIELSSSLIPDAEGIKLGSCGAVFDVERQGLN